MARDYMTALEAAASRFAGKKVLIFGLGLLGGGIGDARFFAGCGATVKITDQKSADKLKTSIDALAHLPVTYTLGGHNQADFEWADIVIRNPSVPQDHPLLQVAANLGKTIEMRTALFMELAGVDTIGITGTRGKTTTTTLIYRLAQAFSGKHVLLGGNTAGVSDLELLGSITNPEETLAIIELSSWQLQGFSQKHLSPHVAVITNLYPDHLNVYPDLNTYYEDKRAIISSQTAADFAVLNQDETLFHTWAESNLATTHWFSGSQLPAEVNLSVPGEHNRANAAAALAVAEIYHWPPDLCLESVKSFKGVPYRLETISVKNGVTYINDTTATTPIATLNALKSCSRPPILICGGNDKKLPIELMVSAINHITKAIILLPGTGTDRLKALLTTMVPLQTADSMQQAVMLASSLAIPGDIVLLSPGFTSFGLFNNEFDRGDQFNQCVRDLE